MPSLYLALDDAHLLAQCTVDTLRASGPGGQHRNKTESGVRLRHNPTGVTVTAFERRSQHENRAVALHRLREAIALEVRTPVDIDSFAMPPELTAILPGAPGGSVGPNNPRFWPGIATVLDLFVALECSVSDTAAALGLSTGALSRLLLESPAVAARVNTLRAARNLRPLR